VEEIVDEKMEGGFLQVLVTWEGFQQKTWEPVCNVALTEAYKMYMRARVREE